MHRLTPSYIKATYKDYKRKFRPYKRRFKRFIERSWGVLGVLFILLLTMWSSAQHNHLTNKDLDRQNQIVEWRESVIQERERIFEIQGLETQLEAEKAEAERLRQHNEELERQVQAKRQPKLLSPSPVYAAGDDVWAALRNCESGGNYATNTGNGYFGAYQFSKPTWDSMNTGYAWPHEAPPAVQDDAAKRLQARSGWGQWPSCSAKLGLY